MISDVSLRKRIDIRKRRDRKVSNIGLIDFINELLNTQWWRE